MSALTERMRTNAGAEQFHENKHFLAAIPPHLLFV